MVDIPEALQHKLGPLAAWQWGALAGGAILVYRVVSSGHQSTGVGTVTLTPNNQPNLGGSGTDTVGSVLSGFAATGLFPTDFSITLPNGTVVTFSGGRIVSTTPASGGGGGNPGTGGSGDGSGGGGLGAQASPLLTIPQGRNSGLQTRPGSPLPWVMPTSRGGPVIAGATPNPFPGSGPANVVIRPPINPGANPPATNPPATTPGAGGGHTPGTGGTGGTPGTTPGGHGGH
jgi:hypothetical protein